MREVEEWIDRAMRGETLIASDFDGTLVDIVSQPGDAQLSDHARLTLSRLANIPGTHLAILSGRTLVDLAPRVAGIGPLWLASDHGAVLIDPLRRAHRLVGQPLDTRAIEKLRGHAEDIARVFRGAHVETKPRGIALHYRDVAEVKQNALIEMFRMSCIVHRAETLHGRKVIEGRFGEGDKGAALAYIASRLPKDTSLIYVGDDVTDEPAFAYAHRHPRGLALHVVSHERIAPRTHVHGWLRGPQDWLELLDAIARVRAPQIEA